MALWRGSRSRRTAPPPPRSAFIGVRSCDLHAIAVQDRVLAAGERLLREAEPASEFFAIRHGTVALETFVSQRGPVTIETVHEGDLLGWSWLVAPHRTVFDARALGVVRTIAFDGACLRGKCEEDAGLGYELIKRFAGVIVERLQATRLRLLDVYGQVPAADAMAPTPYRAAVER